MSVPFFDLTKQYQALQPEIEPAVQALFQSQKFILGQVVADFEKAFAEYCGVGHAVGVASGTDALMLSLRALGVGPGDEVITTPFTFYATAGAIVLCGAKPVFVDIDPATFNINPDLIKAKITKKTKAIIPVHLFGLCADVRAIQKVAPGIPIVEDACQSVGALYHGKRAGALGDLGCFSFFPSKNLGGFGDGGMITCHDAALASKLRMLREHGSQKRYYSEIIGTNSRLDALQAVVLNIKLKHLEKWNQKRQAHAQQYHQAFEQLPIQRPVAQPGFESVYNQYTIRVKDRESLTVFLQSKEIGYAVYYPLPLHLQPCYADLGYKQGDLPEAEKAAEEVLSLPIYPELTKEQVQEVIQAITSFYSI